MIKISLSDFASRTSTDKQKVWRPYELVDWEAVKDAFEHPATAKNKLLVPGWSPAVFAEHGCTPRCKGSTPETRAGCPGVHHRLKANATSVSLLVIDVDKAPQGTMDALIEAATERNERFIAHTSFSHGPDQEKFRLIFELSRPILGADWDQAYPLLAQHVLGKHYGEHDASCKDASRFYYLPAVAEGAEYIFDCDDGSSTYKPLDVDAVLAKAPPHARSLLRAKGVATAPAKKGLSEGNRNNYLFTRTLSLKAKGYNLEQVHTSLARENEASATPLDADEVERVIDHAFGYANARPCTDEGLVERAVEYTNGELVYNRDDGNWYAYDGNVWRHDPDGAHNARLAVKQAITDELETTSDEHFANEKKKVLTRLANNAGITNFNRVAQQSPLFVRQSPEQKKHLIRVENGTVDLRSGQLVISDPDAPPEFYLGSAKGRFTPNALATYAGQRWLQYLDEITCSRPELVSYLQRVAGYCLTGETRERKWFYFDGAGKNGKSVFLNTIHHVLHSYATKLPESLLQGDEKWAHPSEPMIVQHKRVATFSEIAAHSVFNDSRIKLLSSTDALTGRHLYQKQTVFLPTHKMILAGNTRPRVRDMTEGFWDRISMIPFDASFVGREDPTLEVLFQTEEGVSAFLEWAIAGACEWYERGLQEPKVCLTGKEEYRLNENPVESFIAEEATKHEDAFYKCSDFGIHLRAWQNAEGVQPRYQLSNQAIHKRMTNWKTKQIKGIAHWCGIAPKPKFETEKTFLWQTNKNLS